LLTVVAATPAILRDQLSVYDGGLFLTLSRFVSLDHLLYRDLWTLYGPGPPVLGSVVMDLFGPGLGPIRVVTVLIHAVLVAGVFLVARRFSPPWVAAGLSVLVAAVNYPAHFQQTIALLVWGMWLVLRALDDERRASRRLLAASFLFGMSFWGRFEFALVGAGLVVGLWLAARRRPGMVSGRLSLLIGLAPTALFLLYLLGVAGWDRAWLNVVDYPFFRYSDEACRGLPPAWGQATRALLAPLRGELWTIRGLVLWSSTFLAPVLGGLCLWAAAKRWKADHPLRAFAVAAAGGLVLILWLEHRPRASLSPNPIVPLMAIAAALLLGALVTRRPKAGRWTAAAVTAVTALVVVASIIPAAPRVWTGWPAYDPRLGWEGGRVEGLYDAAVWADVRQAVQARTAPEEEIFVALTDNSSRHHANAPIFYWVADRPPATRFIEFDPCLTDTEPVQREIVRDLASVDVVVATTFFPDTSRGGSSVMDDYLDARFEAVYEGDLPGDQRVLVLERLPGR
jgi:hypothetical protein